MHFQFLIEDQSGSFLIEEMMRKIETIYSGITYNVKPFHGIGGFTRKNTIKETKTGKLLNDLATYLRGFNRSLQNIDAAIFVVLDNDTRNTADFRAELEAVAQQNSISVDHVFCVAVEEIESWLLGDEQAILRAYPRAKLTALHNYVQDSICGTWEVLADVVYPGGKSKMVKSCVSYKEIGKIKSEWASKIGHELNIKENRSPSFNYMLGEIERRIQAS